MNIYEKLSKITSEISTVAKNLSVEAGKSSYKAVGEADVLAAVKPIEAKYGVYSYPYKRQVIDSGEIVSTTKYGDRKQLYLRVETVYRFVNVEKPEEYVEITTYGDGVDTQDKAPGKAMTYADKYALLKAYKIQTGDDPDQKGSAELKEMNRQAYPPMEQMVVDVENYIKTSRTASDYVQRQINENGAKDLNSLAFANPALITACWNKWCNR